MIGRVMARLTNLVKNRYTVREKMILFKVPFKIEIPVDGMELETPCKCLKHWK